MVVRFVAALVLSTALVSVSALAQKTPTESGPRDLAAEIARLATLTDPQARLEGLDRLLAQSDQPTRGRGIVQMFRAGELYDKSGGERLAEAQTAIDEAMRLLPNEPEPMLLASEIYTYRGDPSRAADLWMAASKIAPDRARQSEIYDLKALLERLFTDGLYDKGDALLSQMVEVGHAGADTSLRSEAAAAQVRARIKSGDVAGAADAMRRVVSFGAFVDLYTDRLYGPIWPAMDRWTGGDLERQHDASLRAYRSDWRRNGLTNAAAYASSLLTSGVPATVVELFLPTAQAAVTEPLDQFYRAVLAQSVAGALIRLDRGDEAVALLSRLADQFDPEYASPSLTARATLAQTQLFLGRFDDAVATVERFSRDAEALMGTGNRSGLAATEMVRACARIARGDDETDVFVSLQPVLAGAPVSVQWEWYRCLGDVGSAGS